MFFAGDQRNNYERKAAVVTSSDPSIPNLFESDPHGIMETIAMVETMPKDQAERRKSMASQLKVAIKGHVKKLTVQGDSGRRHAGPKYALWGTVSTDGYVCNQLATCLYETAQVKTKAGESKKGGHQDNESRPKLQYLRQAIRDDASYRRVFRNGPKGHLIAAGDPGIANTLTLTKLNTQTGQQSNTSLPRGTHEFSSKWYKRLLERLKNQSSHTDPNDPSLHAKRSICELENGIAPVTVIADIQADDSVILAEIHASFCAHVRSTLKVYSTVREFYGSYGLKVAKHRARQGSQSEVDLSIKTVIDDLVREAAAENLQPVLVLGDGDFTTMKSGNVKCYKYMQRLVNRVSGHLKP
jgi:hypothetical protein